MKIATLQDESSPFQAGHVDAIERAMSQERLARYVVAAGGDKEKAILRYQRNTQLSEALYGPLQGVEILYRNAFNTQLQKNFGDQWFDGLVALEPFQPDADGKLPTTTLKLGRAKDELLQKKKPITAGRMVAELSFGFWVSICARPYTGALWIPCLSRPFKGLSLTRADVHLRLDDIRILRNRVAHHECILSRDLEGDYRKIIETAKLLCGASAKWIDASSCFRERFAKPL